MKEIPDEPKTLEEMLDYFFLPEDKAKWLNFPHPDLGGRTPQSAIDDGDDDAVHGMLWNAMRGILS